MLNKGIFVHSKIILSLFPYFFHLSLISNNFKIPSTSHCTSFPPFFSLFIFFSQSIKGGLRENASHSGKVFGVKLIEVSSCIHCTQSLYLLMVGMKQCHFLKPSQITQVDWVGKILTYDYIEY